MAYVLSLRPQSPLKRCFSDSPYLQSCSPLRDVTIGALREIAPRNPSAASLYILESPRPTEWLRGTENTPDPHASRSKIDLAKDGVNVRSVSAECVQLKRPCSSDRQESTLELIAAPFDLGGGIENHVNHNSKILKTKSINLQPLAVDSDTDDNNDDDDDLFDLYDPIEIPLPDGCWPHHTNSDCNVAPEEAPQIVSDESLPFRRWMSTLRRRHIHRRQEAASKGPPRSLEGAHFEPGLLSPLTQSSKRARALSDSMSSSLGCVRTLQSASITVASTSVAPHSDAGVSWSKVRFGNRSSHYSEARKSTDSCSGLLGPIIDERAWLRSVQRRKVVEELVSSEESYIADLKVLINDYFMVLTGVPSLSAQTRASIQQNVSQILQLHEDLLAELHLAIPQADTAHNAQPDVFTVTRAKHIRFHSADLVPGRFADNNLTRRFRHSLELGRSPDRRPQGGPLIDTKTAGQIAKIFNKHMKRFFTYEEYGAHWTTMSHDLTSTCKGLHGWQEYERGIEALSKVVASENNRVGSSRKALGFTDLLIKPIQRVCKYPLLFGDLCRHTPSYDDPEAHAEIEKALLRLQETIREVNKAKDDPKTRRLIEITWQLQDRLVFEEQTFSRALIFRLLGHVLLCGVLHVTYQTTERPKGQYMVCVLYKSCLVLATAGRFYTPYNVVASIALANGSVEVPDNGRGLQCYTAPHTWKLVFEHTHRLHEIILSACNAQEEDVWKSQLRERISCETHDFVESQATMQDMLSSLSLDIKSIGPVFGHANTLVRRMSVHRAATLGSKQNLTQVIIKNTQVQKVAEPVPTFAPNLVTRSQSHLSVNHIPTLAPRRAERIRLEAALEDVWTKDILPFPGMGNRIRVENQIRASANSVMRKLSMASIASNFSRRTPSFSSVSNTRSEDSFGSKVHKSSHGNLRARAVADRQPAPAVVDFHNAPAAFLPADFELEDIRPPSRRRRLERKIDRNSPDRPKRTRRLSAHLISLPRTDTGSRVEVRTMSAASHPMASDRNEHVFGENRAHVGAVQGTRTTQNQRRDPSNSPPPAKRFLKGKGKSKIFKFWI